MNDNKRNDNKMNDNKFNENNNNINNNNINNIKTEDTKKKSSVVATNNNGKRNTPFWAEDPNIIFNQMFIFEFFPTENMTYNEKLNAISRLIFILTIVGFIFSQSIRLLAVSFITLLSIYLLFRHHTKMTDKHKMGTSGGGGGGMDAIDNFENPKNSTVNGQSQIPFDVLKAKGITVAPKDAVFDNPQENNPFSNVLMSDYDFNPNKKPAPPSYNEDIGKTILEKTKGMVAVTNSSQPDITDKLFKDLGDELYFEQSMRQFYTNPSTTIPNDQNSFADFCYGGMVSCKEGNLFACANNLSRYTN